MKVMYLYFKAVEIKLLQNVEQIRSNKNKEIGKSRLRDLQEILKRQN